MANLLAVAEKKRRKPPALPLAFPPPPGSTWEKIDQARRELGMSASELSAVAMGKTSRSLFSSMGERDAWERAKLETQRKFVDALVARGIPREAFEPAPIVKETLDRSDLARAEEIARDIAADGNHSFAMALAKAVQLKLVTETDIAWRRKTVVALERDAAGEVVPSYAPAPQPPSTAVLTAADSAFKVKRYARDLSERPGGSRSRKNARK